MQYGLFQGIFSRVSSVFLLKEEKCQESSDPADSSTDQKACISCSKRGKGYRVDLMVFPAKGVLPVFGEILENVRKHSPLIHCITNFVTVNDVANILLACGASPIMTDDPDDAAEITAICSGLTINIGTLHARSIDSMFAAGKEAARLHHPILLDPVGAGASTLRTRTSLDLIAGLPQSVIRGNLSEIRALALGSGTTRGVDADVCDRITEETLEETIAFVRRFAMQSGAIVAVTGAIDLVSSADTTFVIRNGRPEMASITGTGCQLSGLITAFVCANPDRPLEAAAAAVCAMGLCGQIAWSRMSGLDGNSSYRNYIIDAMYRLQAKDLESGARYEIR